MAVSENKTRQRVPAAERRDALISAAIHEFAHGGYNGTPVDRIARRVGVAQPYVFSLFGSKRDLFLAAVQRCFALVMERFTESVATYDPATVPEDITVTKWMGRDYMVLMESDRDLLMLQLQAYAACEDEVIRDHVRANFAHLAAHVQQLTGADQEQLDEFFRYGMWCNVAAAMGVENLSVDCTWIQDELASDPSGQDQPG